MSSTFYILTSDESLGLSSWDYNQFKYLWLVKNHLKNAKSSIYYYHHCQKTMPESVKSRCKTCEKIYLFQFGWC